MTRRGWLLFAAMCLIWGVPYLLIKIAVTEVSVPVLVFGRTALGAAALLPLVLRRGQLAGLRRHWRPLLAFATLEIIVPWWLLSAAERDLTSSMTGLLIATSPIIAVLVTRLTGDAERLSTSRRLGLAVGLLGVGTLAGPQLRGGQPWAIVAVLLTSVCYATAPVIAARRLRDVPALPMTAVCLAFAALLYAPPALIAWPATVPSPSALAAIAGLALLCTAIGFVVFFKLIREVGTTRALVFTYVNPAVAVVAGVVVLSEPLTWPILTSFGLILGGSVLATGTRAARPARPSHSESGLDNPALDATPVRHLRTSRRHAYPRRPAARRRTPA